MARGQQRKPDIPEVFRTLGLLFHQDIDGMVETEEELAFLLAGGFSGEARQALHTYLVKIVRSASDDELVRLWNTACPDWFARDGVQVRRMLRLIGDKLKQNRTSPDWRPVGEGLNHGKRVSRAHPAKGG